MLARYISDEALSSAIRVLRENETKWGAGNVPGAAGLTLQEWIATLDELQQRRASMRQDLRAV